jgi:hypothetical protein
MILSRMLGYLWITFGVLWLIIVAQGMFKRPFLLTDGGSQADLLFLLFVFFAIASGVLQSCSKHLGYIGTGIAAIVLLPYIALYFAFLGHRSGPVMIAYCICVALFCLTTLYCTCLRITKKS